MRPKTRVTGGGDIKRKMRGIAGKMAKKNRVFVGVPEGAGAYEDGPKIAVIAAVQEFGSANGRIPERSFLRVPLGSNKQEYVATIRRLVPMVQQGQLTMKQAMDQLGAMAVGHSQAAIAAGISPPNAQSTIDKKGSSQPLIDTGALRQSITWVVKDES